MVQVDQVVRVVSLDDMHSEYILVYVVSTIRLLRTLRCHACEGLTDSILLSAEFAISTLLLKIMVKC